jgi:hypothetical protein
VTDWTILVSSWSDGLFVLEPGGRGHGPGHPARHEHTGRCVAGLAADGRGGAIAVVDRTTVARRHPPGTWTDLATSERPLECCLALRGSIHAGTEDAHLLRIHDDDGHARVERVSGFDAVEGRESWYAGSAVVDGRTVGPPLAVRSLAATSDGRVLLAAVHVGGIVRSVDGGVGWRPTIPIDWDVHEVCAHSGDPATVAAAMAAGPCISRDGGASWALVETGSTETHCSAVAFAGDDLLVSVARDPFADHGRVLRRPVGSSGPPEAVGGGLPDRLEGIVDTRCIATKGLRAAVVDRGGNVYASSDGGRRWTRRAEGIPHPSGALIVEP